MISLKINSPLLTAFSFTILSLVSTCSSEDFQPPSVTLQNGNTLVGVFQNALYTDRKFVEFRGIRYAQPPVGPLRFKAPKPYEEVLDEPQDATEYGAACPQIDIFNDQREETHVEDVLTTGDEDCLFLNVATPYSPTEEDPTNETGYPVIVWLHGGSFQYESGDIYGPHGFLKESVVLVTLNYRLGVLGFLNSQENGIVGNFGLKDQSLALKWVKQNIKSFGGNPESITLMGVNAGAVSAHLHMLSPMSQGLFHRVYLQSGTALAPWGIVRNATNKANNFLKWISECTNYSSTSECLQNVDWQAIVTRQQRLTEWYIDPLVPMGPSIETSNEPNTPNPPFLTKDPIELIASGDFWAKDKVPMILGVNSDEGLLHSVDIAHHTTLYRTLNMEWVRAIPISLLLRDTLSPGKSLTDLTFAIKDFYFGPVQFEDLPSDPEAPEELKELVSPDGTQKKQIRNTKAPRWKFIGQNFFQFEELTEMYSDRFFNVPAHHTALLHGGTQPKVYLYWFDYRGSQSTTQMTGYNDTIFGVSHFDQVQYLFRTPYFKELEDEGEVAFARKYIAGIVRFAYEGEPPSGEWVHVTKEMVEKTVPLIYNRLGSPKDAYQLVERFTKRVEFWESLPLMEYGKKVNQESDNKSDKDEL